MFVETASLLRVLLDSGSQANFISESCLSLLGIKHRNLLTPLHVLAHIPLTSAKGVASCIITPSGRKEPYLPIEALVLPQIPSQVPSTFLKSDSWEHIRQLQLTDPTFATPGETDILLGAEIFPELLTAKKVDPQEHQLLINTYLQPGISSFISNVQQPTLNEVLKNVCEI
ncbi:hypothetical protein PR048_016940 [Dryococelus australis]|uniref:Peptidase aspartic putative domain-containing protein n=1 Tax=Dryococelus australis TaxID=614101 RepID=A0ABQ9H839_9NEOP|nr:hypothetical protein PR048_016940 [Dryococelus australis]